MKKYNVSYREMAIVKAATKTEVIERAKELTDEDILRIVEWDISHDNSTDEDCGVKDNYKNALEFAKQIAFGNAFELVQTQVGFEARCNVAFITEEDTNADGDVEVLSVTTVISKTSCNFIVKRVNQK
ncbi:MAG: hypothetical protein J5958_06505 [Clostridia bacterium]|nr:hypothetical protein [Clostridia bacterium]